jgi:glycerol-3-phosphate acyltransferase PlsY
MGATNTYRQAGLAAAALVALVDLLKGVAAAWLGLALSGEPWALPVAGGAAVAGHCWSVYIGFRGGMGLATAGGIFLWVLPGGPLVFAVIWLAARLALRRTAWAAVIALAAGTPASLLLWRPLPAVTAYSLLAVAVLLVRYLSQLIQSGQSTGKNS